VDLSVVGSVFAVIFLAELPDKSLLASLVLGTRYRPLLVWAGVSTALFVHVLIAVAAGGVLSLLPRRLVQAVVVLLFALGAYLLLRPEAASGGVDEEAANEEVAAEQEASRVLRRAVATPWRVVATSFGIVFVGEWGDITQLATANLAARYEDPLSVGVGAALALVAVAGLAVRAGGAVLRWVPLGVVRRLAGLLLAALAVLALVPLLR